MRECRSSANVEAMEHDAQLVLAAGAVLAACVLAAGLAARLRLPALVLFAGLGMLGFQSKNQNH